MLGKFNKIIDLKNNISVCLYRVSTNECGILVGVESLPTLSSEIE
jgi:hypothetical protein